MPKLRQMFLICAALLGGASSALAHIEVPCFEERASADDLAIALSKDGWVAADRNDAAVIDPLSWMGMPRYFLGDRGGSRLEHTPGIKYLAAKGIWNKKDLPGSQTRILTRMRGDTSGVAKVIWTKATEHYTNISCTFSLIGGSIQGFDEGITKLAPLPNFTRLNIDIPQLSDKRTFASMVAANRKKLSGTLNVTVPVDVIIETSLGYWTKEN